MTYTGNGNILTKTGVTAGAGVYQYGQNGAGPHAVTGISQAATDYNHYSSFHYDANGNMDCRGATTSACSGGDPVSWYAFNKPQQITRGSDSASFVYGPNRSRIKQKRVAGTKTLNIDYAGNHFEREKVDNKIRWRLNVYAYGELIYWIQEYRIQNTCSVTTGSDSYFVLKDHLGSVDQTVHDQGSGSGEQHSYDAFGLRRDVAGWADDADYSQLTTDEQLDRGYTEHEHLDNVRAIHMNGRVQDPIIGRMLSVDPIVGGATPQTHNGYSYVGNNPLSYTDPSGFFVCWPYSRESESHIFGVIANNSARTENSPGAEYDTSPLVITLNWSVVTTIFSYGGAPSTINQEGCGIDPPFVTDTEIRILETYETWYYELTEQGATPQEAEDIIYNRDRSGGGESQGGGLSIQPIPPAPLPPTNNIPPNVFGGTIASGAEQTQLVVDVIGDAELSIAVVPAPFGGDISNVSVTIQQSGIMEVIQRGSENAPVEVTPANPLFVPIPGPPDGGARDISIRVSNQGPRRVLPLLRGQQKLPPTLVRK